MKKKFKMDLNKNYLKNLKYLFVIAAISSFTAIYTSCSDDFEDPMNSIQYQKNDLLTMDYSDLRDIKSDGFYWDSEEANMIAVRFLELDAVEGKYVLNMSHEESKELHILDSDFERMIREIEATNDSIKKWSRNKNMVLELSNPEDYIKNTLQIDSKFKVRLKSGQEQPGERTVNVSTGGLDWGSSTIWLPMDAQIPINVTCYSPFTLTPLFNIKAGTCGTEAIKGGVGVNGTWTTTITPHCSNTTCKFSFKTSSTNGGTGTFKY